MTRTNFFIRLLLPLLFLSGCGDLIQQRQSLGGRTNTVQKRPSQPQQAVTDKTIIGVLLPLSGGAKDVGKSSLDAAKMAVFDLRADNIILKPYDTPGDANKAKSNAQAVISEGAHVILGPVFSADTRAITSLAQDADVPVLSLSNTPEVARPGIYPLGYNPADQTRSVTQHLLSQGKQNFAVLAPNTRYTQLAVNALKNTVQDQGRIMREIYYDKSVRSFDMYIDQLTDSGRTVDFEALFLPERGEKLERLTTALRDKGITPDRIQFFGPDSWDEMSTTTCQLTRKGMYAAADRVEMEKFKQRFQSTYGYCPADIASIAYDMVAMIASLSKGGYKISNELITNHNGFKGIDGPFRLSPEGKVERNYAIYEVDTNGPQTILPPARVF